MQRIRIGVVRTRSFRSTDGFEVYGDGGTGQIDWVHPVTARRVLLWPDAPAGGGHVVVGHLQCVHLDSVWRDGHLEGTHLLDGALRPGGLVSHETAPFVFGRFRHAVVIKDAAGNEFRDGAVVREIVINSDPPPACHLVPVSHDGETGRMTFSFCPSDRLTG